MGYDIGVIYYEFIPENDLPDTQPAIAFEPSPEFFKEKTTKGNANNLWGKAIVLAAVIAAFVSPIPGDEVIALGALLALP